MIFRQLFEPTSSTYTYLLGCEDSGQAVLIDPVLPMWQRDLEEIAALGLRLAYTVETHFQNGDAATLYASVHDKLFTLPEDTLVYPAHDYKGRRVSTVGQEKARNPRLGGGRDLKTFLGIMQALDLPYPKFIDHAVPGNRQCGVCPDGIPDSLQQYCESISLSLQG